MGEKVYVCSTREGLSVSLGLISVVSWCVAEIPQIITNYNKKSAEGLSILFLSTWIIGDSFNLVGCMIQPEILPTQYYTALLYAVTTVILTLQAVYYHHIYPRLKSEKRRREGQHAIESVLFSVFLYMSRISLLAAMGMHGEAVERRECYDPDTAPSSAVSDASSSYNELYFMSARSLSVSRTLPAVSFLGSRSPVVDIEQRWFKEPLLVMSPNSAAPKIKTTLCVISLVTFLVGSHNHLHLPPGRLGGGIVLQAGRQLLEPEATSSSAFKSIPAGHSGIGSALGWGMSAIYLGGRLPQIYLNMKRGHTEGLNALMFVFAVIGNTTYVASILLNSLDWVKIKPNLPWLVDAGGCAILDIFILIQFIYFRYRPRNVVDKYVS